MKDFSVLINIFCFSESNAGSITHLVTSEQPLAIAPPTLEFHKPVENSQQYKSQPSLSHSPIYNNLISPSQSSLAKAQSYTDNLNNTNEKQVDLKTAINVEDLQLDPIVLRESHMLANLNEKTKFPDLKLDNDLTLQEKENSLLSASRLRLLQDTTMIESALDLDSLDDFS